VIPRRRSSVLRDLGDYTGARAGFQRALAIDEAALGARLHVRPWFADRPIERIGPANVRRWQRDLGGKVGPATLGQCRSLALRIFQFALDEGAIDTNSVGKVPAPSAAPTPTWSCGPASAAPLTPEEAGQLLACFPPFWWDHVITLLGTGLRIGELAGLHRRRVQLNQPVPTLQVVDVRYQAGRFGSGFKPRPKSDASIREVPLAPRSWRRSAAASRPGSDPAAVLFTGPGGGPGQRGSLGCGGAPGRCRRGTTSAAPTTARSPSSPTRQPPGCARRWPPAWWPRSRSAWRWSWRRPRRPSTSNDLRNAASVRAATRRRLLANCWQATLGAGAEKVNCLVELRGLNPLTPCMPSTDPHHNAHHETSSSRPLHQTRRAGAWWFVRVRRAVLLRVCCAKWLKRRVHRDELLAQRSLAILRVASCLRCEAAPPGQGA
jgi:hypothetical protein